MILQEEFQKSGYTDLLAVDAVSQYGIDPEGLFDSESQPEELLGIYISEQGDDLFFLLYGKPEEIGSLCDQWDDRIRVFTLINGKTEAVRKLKYNIVQLIVCSGETPDKSKEGNLQISRKIILKGKKADDGRICIEDDEVIELPFHIIPADTFAQDEEKVRKLSQLLPEDEGLLEMLKKKQKKVYNSRKSENGPNKKSFKEQDFEKIKGWLER